MNRIQQLRDFITACENDFSKFYEKGNASAGTRVRKSMQELKKLANEIRTEVQDRKTSEKS